jgi:hypothetical protein
MAVTIPPILVVIVCRVALSASPVADSNSEFTHWQNLEWATENSMMQCRRHEVTLYDPDEGKPDANGNPTPPLEADFTQKTQCARAAMALAMDMDQKFGNRPWRVWRVGCPAPIVDTRTGALIGYKLPECGHQDTVHCEIDSAI